MASCGVASTVMNLLEDHRGRRPVEPWAAEFFRDRGRQISCLHQGIDEVRWILPQSITSSPILASELPAHLGNTFANLPKVGIEIIDAHLCFSAPPVFRRRAVYDVVIRHALQLSTRIWCR